MLFEIPKFLKIPRCYDSHLHLLATGQVSSEVQLGSLKSQHEISNIKLDPENFRGDWLIGFGWNQNDWPGQKFPSRKVLDQFFPDFPVAFSRSDGHALWVNTKAMELAGINSNSHSPIGGSITYDESGYPDGVFIDTAKAQIEQLIPGPAKTQKKSYLSKAILKMNKEGFTHIRDMSADAELFQLLLELDEQKSLSLYVDLNFSFEEGAHFQKALDSAFEFKKNNRSKKLRFSGIKFYIDGALGSEGAWLSSNYIGKGHNGFSIYTENEIKNFISECWARNLPVAIHTIGDKAVDMVANVALQIQESGLRGEINFEHGEIIRSETVLKISKLNSRVHMQPCHWLSDHKWLEKKVGSLIRDSFPWSQLSLANVPISFGSDTPIERPSLSDNFLALEQSSLKGVKPPAGDVIQYFSHPDLSWGEACWTEIKDGKVVKTIFDGEVISNV